MDWVLVVRPFLQVDSLMDRRDGTAFVMQIQEARLLLWKCSAHVSYALCSKLASNIKEPTCPLFWLHHLFSSHLSFLFIMNLVSFCIMPGLSVSPNSIQKSRFVHLV